MGGTGGSWMSHCRTKRWNSMASGVDAAGAGTDQCRAEFTSIQIAMVYSLWQTGACSLTETRSFAVHCLQGERARCHSSLQSPIGFIHS